MIDTTKPVDLSTLEQGDTVVFRDGQKSLVNHICDNGYDGLKLYMFVVCDSNKQPLQFEDDYEQDGQVQFHSTHENDIIQIIKNPKRWTNEDIRKAWLAGSDPMDWDGNVYETFKEWFEHYKQVNHER